MSERGGENREISEENPLERDGESRQVQEAQAGTARAADWPAPGAVGGGYRYDNLQAVTIPSLIESCFFFLAHIPESLNRAITSEYVWIWSVT